MSFFCRLEHKAQSRIVALILDATEPAATALEAYAAGFAHTHPVERAVGAGGERLGQHRVQVLGQPRDTQLFRQLVKGVLGEAVALPQGRKGRFAFLCVCLGDGSGHLPGGIGSHLAQAALPCREHGVVELPSGFQVRTLAGRLTCLDEERQLEQKRRCLRLRGHALPTCFGAHQHHAFLYIEHLFQS